MTFLIGILALLFGFVVPVWFWILSIGLPLLLGLLQIATGKDDKNKTPQVETVPSVYCLILLFNANISFFEKFGYHRILGLESFFWWLYLIITVLAFICIVTSIAIKLNK